MKKIICIITGLAVLVAMSATAFAEPLDASSLQTDGQAVQAVQVDTASGSAQSKLAAQQANLAFRETVLKDREAILNNAQKNADLVLQNKQMRNQIKQEIISFRQNGEKLTDDAKTQLKDYNSQLKTLAASLTDTKGQLKTAMDAFKAAVKAKDSTALQTAFDQATSVQNSRNSLLTQINGVLQKISDLVASSGSVTSASPTASVEPGASV